MPADRRPTTRKLPINKEVKSDMIYSVNGKQRESAPISIAELVTELTGDQSPTGVAVAINETVVPRSDWDRGIAPDDAVDVLTAVQGG